MTKVYIGKDKIGMEIQVAISDTNDVYHRVQGINQVSQSITFSKWSKYNCDVNENTISNNVFSYIDVRSFLVYKLVLNENIKVRLPKVKSIMVDDVKSQEFDVFLNDFFK